MRDVEKAWADSLNPDVVRQKLTKVGLFMVAHELLVGCIKDRPRCFFADEFRDGIPVTSKKYKVEVLALDPKGKSDPVRGGTEWLKRMSVIDKADGIAIREVTDVRNRMAHELGDIVMGGGMPDMAGHLLKLLGLIKKIERWWVVNVEVPTNPDFDGEHVDEGGVMSGSEIVMSILWDVAMGEGEEGMGSL